VAVLVAELVVVLIWLIGVLDNVVAGGGGGDDVAVAEVLGNIVLVDGEDVESAGDDEARGVDEAGDIQATSQ
jgi:hypothetical protein